MPSQVIIRFVYRPPEGELEILFTTGRCYLFHDVPPEAAEAFRSAFSKGRHFNARIRGRYRFTEQRDTVGPNLPAPEREVALGSCKGT